MEEYKEDNGGAGWRGMVVVGRWWREGNLEEWEIWPWPRGMHGMRPVMPGQSHGNPPSFRSTSILVSSSLHPTRPPKIAYQFAAIPRLCVLTNLRINFLYPRSIRSSFYLSVSSTCDLFRDLYLLSSFSWWWIFENMKSGGRMSWNLWNRR